VQSETKPVPGKYRAGRGREAGMGGGQHCDRADLTAVELTVYTVVWLDTDRDGHQDGSFMGVF